MLLLGLSLLHLVFPQRAGWAALTQIFAPYLFLPLLLLAPLAFLRGAPLLRLALVACLVLAGLRFSPPLRLSSPTPAPGASEVAVLNWNVGRNWRAGQRDGTMLVSAEEAQAARVRPLLATRPADIVVLEEAYWAWLRRDPDVARHYPHQLVHTEQASSGLVLLSAFPFLDRGVAEVPREQRGWPRLLWARLDLGRGRTLLVVAAHPEAPRVDLADGYGYDPSERDALLPRIRQLIDPTLARGEPVLLAGDLNATEREPAYHELARGLQDAHRRAGAGLGHTWGLAPDLGWPLPLLRIDYLFGGPGVTPLRASVDCTPRGSDHCLVQGSFAVADNSAP